MSEGSSGGTERKQDVRSPADSAQPGAGAGQPEVTGYPSAGPDSWSTTWADPVSPAAQPGPSGPTGPDSWSTTWANPASPALPTPPAQPGGSDGTGQQPPPAANAFTPAGAEPRTPPASDNQPPGGQSQPTPGQYPPTAQYAPPGQYPPTAQYAPPGQYPPTAQYAPPGQYAQTAQYAPPGQYPQTGQYPASAGQYSYQPTPGQYGYQQWPYPPTAPAPRSNRVAIAALVCGLAQFVLGVFIVGNIVLAVPAVICGAIGIRQTRERGEPGRGMAIAGLVLGIIGVVYFVVIVVVIIVLASIHHASST